MISLVVAQPRENEWGRKSPGAIWEDKDRAKKEVETILGDDVTVLDCWDDRPLRMIALEVGLLGYADAVYFCEGWRDSAECRVLHECAMNFGVKRIIEPAGQMNVEVKDGTAKKELPKDAGEVRAILERKGYRPLRRCDFLDTRELKAVFIGVNTFLTTGEEYTVRYMEKRNTVSIPMSENPDAESNGGAEFGLSRFMVKR